MADDVSAISLASEKPNVGMDGQTTNVRDRGNMFEDEVVLTEKQKLRQKMDQDKVAMKEMLKQMTAIDIFVLFDDDDSGCIDYEEFRRMLPMLDINIPDAKAFRYFRMCDTDGSGEIDLDEFKVALFTCDPTSGNPVGFKPSKYLTPMDAFEMFDEDKSGFLDEDEFYYAFEYLKLKLKDNLHEKLFHKFDFNQTGSIDYYEFRDIFFLVCDVDLELEHRGIDVPSFTSRETKVNMLKPLMLEEEEKERRAVAEAKRYKTWLQQIREKRKLLTKAGWRSIFELKAAFDAGGQVYCFGGGSRGQFLDEPPRKMGTDSFNFESFDMLTGMWKDRIKPEGMVDRLKIERRTMFQDEEREEAENAVGGAIGGQQRQNKTRQLRNCFIDPYQEALASNFKGLEIATNTVTLWGRRVHHIAMSESVAFAITDSGDIFTWGGNNYWWHEIQADSVFQSKWRGDTTPRSQLLLSTTDKTLPADDGSGDAPTAEKENPDEKKVAIIKGVTKYYNCWEPPRNASNRMHYLEKELLPKVSYDQVRFSLELRGKVVKEATKLELCEELNEDIEMEKKLLGERAAKAIRELETQVIGLEKRKSNKLANEIRGRIDVMWKPLREVQAEERAAKKAKAVADAYNEAVNLETTYQQWRGRIKDNRETMKPEMTPRGNSLKINLSGLTPRGPMHGTPRGYQSSVQVVAGQSHAALVHKNGQLYTWGTGISGRLGLDLTEGGDPQKDAGKPRLVQALAGQPVIRVSAGFSHTGAIAAGGDLYMWGSCATGKCGLGTVTKKQECYCSVPTKVVIGKNRTVRKLSCGAAHTACVTDGGQLFVFGCGDGGRLGLGNREYKYDDVYMPALVDMLEHEHISSVSCGNTTTLVTTEIKHVWRGEKSARYRALGGGLVYMAGSLNVLGKQCDNFTLLESMKNTPIKQVSAGYMHTALVTAQGELFCFGRNRKACCGSNPHLHFLEHPQRVECLYQSPSCLTNGPRVTCRQSSTYSGRTADKAIDGNFEGFGMKGCSSTQQDPQAWWEVDLGQLANIEEIRLWNRTDSPHDRTSAQNMYTQRLFPVWVMISNDPFENSTGNISLKKSLAQSIAKTKFTENSRMSTWKTPKNTQGQYIRVQLEGFNFLTLAQVEILGQRGYDRGVGKVNFACAGVDCTMAVIRPSTDPSDIENLYRRAVYSDSNSADIIRQLETYALEYDKYGRGEVLVGADTCAICSGIDKCEICTVMDMYLDEINAMAPGVGGRRRRLNSIEEYLLNHSKPALELETMPKKERPTKWEVRKSKYGPMWGKFKKYWNAVKKPKKAVALKMAADIEEDPADIIAAFKKKKMNDLGIDDDVGADIEVTVEETTRPKPPPLPEDKSRTAKHAIPKVMAERIEKTDAIMAEKKQWEEVEEARRKAAEAAKLAK